MPMLCGFKVRSNDELRLKAFAMRAGVNLLPVSSSSGVIPLGEGDPAKLLAKCELGAHVRFEVMALCFSREAQVYILKHDAGEVGLLGTPYVVAGLAPGAGHDAVAGVVRGHRLMGLREGDIEFGDVFIRGRTGYRDDMMDWRYRLPS